MNNFKKLMIVAACLLTAGLSYTRAKSAAPIAQAAAPQASAAAPQASATPTTTYTVTNTTTYNVSVTFYNETYQSISSAINLGGKQNMNIPVNARHLSVKSGSKEVINAYDNTLNSTTNYLIVYANSVWSLKAAA